MRPLLNYMGGKWHHANWIISNFPAHSIYVEPFGGGASVLLLKPRSKREVINDVDDEIVNLYRVVRNRGKELRQRLDMTPHSRTEYLYAHSNQAGKSSLERARRTVVKSYFGIGDSVHNQNGFRSSKTSNTCVATSWRNWQGHLDEIIERFRGVTIECLDYQDVIRKYDSPETLFYMDPPYVWSTRDKSHSYAHEMTDADHKEFLEVVRGIKGMCLISGYNNPIYQESLGWRRVDQEYKTQKATYKVESLWLCPKVERAGIQMNLGGAL